MSRAAAGSLSVLVALLVVAPSAHGYVTLKYGDSELHWAGTNVTYYIHSSGSADVTAAQLEAAIAGAFQAWQDVTCADVTFTYGGRRSSQPGSGIFLRFQESNWDPSVGDAAAYSTPTSASWQTGVISASEIVFNGEDITWTTAPSESASGFKSDIQGVAAHEIGHSLGLAHTRDLEATMFFSSGLSAELRTLEADDQRGACYIYPTGTFTQGQVCDACTANSHCAAGSCITYYEAPEYYCGRSCTTDAHCPAGYWCYTDDGLNQCVPNNGYCDDAGGNMPIGEFCYGYSVCEAGLFCLPTGSDAYCSKECTTTCPGGLQCVSGYCVRGGGGALGDPCESHFDCESLTCATLSPGTYVCVQDCATDADCPDGFGCAWEVCFRQGAEPFGAPCADHTDCASAYCAGLGAAKYCSDDCRSDADCPVGSYCTSNDYCSKVNIQTGSPCVVSGDCPDGDFCRYESEEAPTGVCATECNPFTGVGCAAGQVCAWVEMPWVGRIKGECKDRNGLPGLGHPCDPGTGCEWDAVCASHEGGPLQCWADCRTDTGQGCAGEERCLSLNEPASPTHGFCWVAPVVAPDSGRSDTAQPPRDAGRPGPDGGQPGPDGGGGPGPDGGTPGVDLGGGGDGAHGGGDGSSGGGGGGGDGLDGGGGGGGCAAGGPAGAGPLAALPLALLLAVAGGRVLAPRRRGRRAA